MTKTTDLTIFISSSDSTCNECGEALAREAWITLDEERNALFLVCSDQEHRYYPDPRL